MPLPLSSRLKNSVQRALRSRVLALVLAPLCLPAISYLGGVADQRNGSAGLPARSPESPSWGLDAQLGVQRYSSCGFGRGITDELYEAGVRAAGRLWGPVMPVPNGMPRTRSEARALLADARFLSKAELEFNPLLRWVRTHGDPTTPLRIRGVEDVVLLGSHRAIMVIDPYSGQALAYFGDLPFGEQPPLVQEIPALR